MCTAHVEKHQDGPRALPHTLHHYALWANIILGGLIWLFHPNRQTAKFFLIYAV